MSKIAYNELEALATEFDALRQSENKRSFPKTIWKKAIELAQQMSVEQVSKAINISPAYLKRKISLLGSSNAEMTFVELIPPKYEPSINVKINIESPLGHKMIIDGITPAALAPILAVFLKEGGLSCCK